MSWPVRVAPMKRLLLLLLVLAALALLVWYATREAEAQGAVYTPGNVLTVVSSFPPSCADGNLIILSASANGFAAGTMHGCLNNAFVPILPAKLVVAGPTLPAACAVGDVYTITPTGALWSCPVTNTFVPVAAGVVAAKTVLGLANNVATPILQVTVPNAASAAVIDVDLSGSLGAGGAVGPYESSIGAHVLVTITRTPGLATVKNLVIQPAPDARVAGGAAISQDVTLSANVGANTASQTFSIDYKVSRGTGSSTNHIASATSRVVSPALTLISVQ